MAGICAVALVLSLVTPVSAIEYSATIYKNDFQSYKDGASSNGASFIGASRSEVWYPDKSDQSASGAVRPDAANRDAITFFDRGGGDIAMRFGTSSDSYTHSYYTQANIFGLSGTTFTRGNGDVLHVGVSMMAEEKSYDKKLVLRRSRDKAWNQIINFSADGNLKVWNTTICTYNAKEWYDIDIWYDFDTKKVYVYLNNKLAKILTDSAYFTQDSESIDIFQITAQVPAKVKGAMCFGYIDIGMLSSSDLPASRNEVGKLLGFASLDYADERQNDSIKLSTPDEVHSDYYRPSGLLGKTENDKSLNIYDDASMGTEGVGVPSHSVEPLISSLGYTSEDNLHFTYLLAIDSTAYNGVNVKLSMDDGSMCDVVSVMPDGQLTCDYKSDAENLPVIEKDRWNRFDIVVKGADSTMNLYVNGTKYIVDAFLPASPAVDGRYQISYNTLSGKEGGFYIDDVFMASYSSDELPSAPEIDITSNVVSVTEAGNIKVPFDYTVSQLEDSIRSSSLPFEVRTKSGDVLSGDDKVIDAMSNDNYIVFKPSAGGEYFCDIEGIPNPPTAEITGISDSAVYGMDDIPPIVVDTSKGTYDISRLELYIDGELFGTVYEAPYTFKIGSLSIGCHTVGARVYDLYGNSSDATQLTFDVIKTYIASFSTKHAFFNPSSTSYETSGTILNTGVNGNLSHMYTVSKGVLIAESDMIFSEEGVAGHVAVRGVKENSTNEDISIIYFADGKIINGGEKGEVIGSYIPGREYHFYFAADAVNKKYNFVMTDNTTGKKVADTSWQQLPHVGISSVSIIRIFCTSAPSVGSGIVCSNVKTSVKSEYPEFSHFADKDGTSPVPHGSDTVICSFSSDIETLTKDNIVAVNSIGQVEVKAAELTDANTLKLSFADELLPSMTYSITLDENVKLLNQTPTGMKISGEFTTSSKPLDVLGGAFNTDGGISFTANMVNEGETANVTVIMSVYQNGVLKEITAKTAPVPNGGCSISTSKISLPSGYIYAEAFVIESWTSQKSVSPKLFKYKLS